jgi:transmembrane sensor
MNRQAFKELLRRYLDNTCTLDERRLVDYWFESYQLNQEESETNWNELENSLWDKIQDKIEQNEPDTYKMSIWRRPIFKYGIAAGIILLIGFYAFFMQNEKSNAQYFSEIPSETITKENNTQKPISVVLEDGSRVELAPNASVVYPSKFSSKLREVRLIGEAFFDIKSNPDKPFLVITDKVVTKVLGTSFYVKAKENSKVEVEVKTGKVTVFERNAKDLSNNGVILFPNHKVTYYSEGKHFVTGISEKPAVIKPEVKEIDFTLKNIPLSEVIIRLEKMYGIEILLENESLEKCTITGDLNAMEMFTQLDVLTQILGADYQIKGTTILISGNGCQ